ncbi:ABC transporter permease [Kaistia dalseonensis]|uniref:Octopine/nopaline transport system permease protein n=1 Tax=Kaistia dalseonensis TaxID=410840 RepID=A0ABU0H0K8_9HYPH|nr:ABC transporter permease [Kaistia dalseonensis]MCX5493288.1 ABC transporter permease [Kaistia dalseonensis]MDQ0435845.1 octopine/nopaline transport system permease protein [Kaistia dalseonensis]
MDFPFLIDTLGKLMAALPTTLGLFSLSVTIGGLLAIGIVWMRVSGHFVLERFARAYVFVFRGSPLLIQMFLVYYGLGQFPAVRHSLFWPLLREPFACAVISLALCTAGYTAEIFRGGLLAVPAREVEAARATGMSGFLLLRRIIAPIALRQALPSYSTEIVLMVKSTALASLVTVWEVTGVAQRIISQTYRTMEVFLCAAAIYLVLNFIIVRLIGLWEHRLSRHRRGMPVSSLSKPLQAGGNLGDAS